MIRSARLRLSPVVALAIAGVAGCSTARAPEPSTPEPTAAVPMEVAVLSGVDAVEATGLGKMWTFDNAPLSYLEERYDFRPSDEWFEHVRLASLRTGGCSASFVSPEGLVMTNHHCARGCISAVSTAEHDYGVEGFYAPAGDDEPVCPGMYLDQLIAIEEVTARIDAAAANVVDDEEATRLKQREAERVQDECQATGGLRCQVVSLYHGGIYSLYKYRRYDDVRLVFAPEGQAAFFGGDPDNFTYPRHDLDVTLLRAYENGEPVRPEHYFAWSDAGADEGELVFVTGNPGSTGRLLTLAQLEYLRDASYPITLEQLHQRVEVMKEVVEEDPGKEQRYRNAIFGVENSIKAITGYLSGLLDPTLMERKAAWEAGFRAAVGADPRLQAEYGGAWREIAGVNAELTELEPERRWTSVGSFRLLSLAMDIVAYVDEMAKPEAERSEAYSGGNLERIERRIYSPAPIDLAYEERLLARHLASARDVLGATHPFVEAALLGREPAAAAQTLVHGCGLIEVEARRALVEAGPEAVAASEDPAIALAREVYEMRQALEERLHALDARESVNEERIAKALFEVYGTALPPDATFTLRLSDGVVSRYPLNGTFAPYKTTFYGLYDRAASFDHQDPWNLAAKWKERREAVDMSTPLDFVCTADIIGGNSGSPVINRDAEVVGLIFDGNMEMLPNRFLYRDEVARAVAVHSQAIIEALRKIYDAGKLADELEGKR